MTNRTQSKKRSDKSMKTEQLKKKMDKDKKILVTPIEWDEPMMGDK